MESDWRKFRDMAPTLRERYIADQNRRVIHLLTEPGKTETERFWDVLEFMKREAKTLRECLDGHSRSKMTGFMRSMLAAGMMTPEDLARFSEPVREEFPEEWLERVRAVRRGD